MKQLPQFKRKLKVDLEMMKSREYAAILVIHVMRCLHKKHILESKYTPKNKTSLQVVNVTYITWDTRVLPLHCKGVAYFRRALSHKPTHASIILQSKPF